MNCWNHTWILPAAISAPPAVIEENETVPLDELRKLLLEFGASGSDICSAEEFIDIPAERWTESPESDDNESELAAVLPGCMNVKSQQGPMLLMMIVLKSESRLCL